MAKMNPNGVALALSAALTLALPVATAQAQEDLPARAPADDDGDDGIEEVIVTGLRASLAQSVDIKRESIDIVDSIVATDIGKFPDNNVVEALQRVTGVQVTDRGAGEVTRVSIRGLEDVTTTVNGRNIFTASGRSVALADIPASLLARTDIYKTRSSELIETGIAGVIDIHTQRPFNFEGPKVVLAARGIYQEQRDKIDPNLSALLSNTWQTDAGRLGALVNVSYAETNYRDQSLTSGAMVPFWTENPPPGFTPLQRIFPVEQGVEVWQPGLEAGLPFAEGSTLNWMGEDYEYYLSRDAVFASDFTGKRKRPAANISLQWAPNERSEYLFEAFYNGYRNESFNSLLFSFVDWWGALGDNPGSTISLYDGTNIIRERSAVGFPYNFVSGDLATGKTDSYVYALGGNWMIGDQLDLRSELVYQTSKFASTFFAMRGDRVTDTVSVNFNDHDGIPAFAFGENGDPADPAQWNMAQLYDNANYNKGDAFTWTGDGKFSADWGPVKNVKFGARYDDRSAEEGQRTQDAPPCGSGTDTCLFSSYPGLASINSGFFDGHANVPTSWFVPNGYYIRDNADEFRALYGLPTSDQLSMTKNFEVDEATTAVYGMVEFDTLLLGHVLDGQFGARYVNVETDMAFGGESASASASKLLPSVMVRYELVPDVNLRLSYGQTLRRPAFAQLNPNITYVEDVTNIGYGTATGGNPDLKPTESKNYDLAVEYYFGKGNAIFASLFRREIDGLVVDFRNRVTYEGYDYILSQPDNASNGELEGYELGVVWFPEFLPGVLDGLGVQASYTSLDSKQDIPITNTAGEVVGTDTTPMFGVSDSSYSVVLAYERKYFDARLSYVWRDDFLNNYEAALFANPLGVYREAETSLDFQLSVYPMEGLTLTFDATNLTEEIYHSYYEYPDTHNFGNALYSRTFALGLRYDF